MYGSPSSEALKSKLEECDGKIYCVKDDKMA